MPRTAPLPAKLTRPRLLHAIERTRLFAALDASRERLVTWLSGPPGSGKSFLAAAWIEVNKIPALWYHLDPTDGDGGTLFHYLTLAARAGPARRRLPLPTFTPEYGTELPRYARLFFRDLAAGLAPDSVLVFDDYHALDANSPVHRALAAGLEELTGRAHIIVVSRTAPPAAFMRCAAAGQLVLQGGEALKFTEAEAAEALRASSILDDKVAQAIHQRTQGWAAGLRLMLAGSDLSSSTTTVEGNEQAVFDYFASEVWETVPDDLRHMLLVTSLLPDFSASMAKELSGSARAGEWLDELCRRNLFITRRGGKDGSHRYHDLFRAFLSARAHQQFSRTQWRALGLRAAHLLAAAGRGEAALAHFRNAQAWEQARELFKSLAPVMLAQGRAQALLDAVGTLPASLPSDPWAEYWRGVALTSANPVQARTHLEFAHSIFSDKGDITGALVTAAAIVDGHFLEYGDVASLNRWIPILAKHLSAAPDGMLPSRLLEVSASALLAMIFCAPGHPLLRECVRHSLALAAREADPNRRVRACTALLAYGGFAFDLDTARRAIDLVGTIPNATQVTEVNRYRWHDFKAYLHFVAGEFAKEDLEVQRLDSLSTRVPSALSPMSVLSDRLHSALARGAIEAAKTNQARMEMELDPLHRTDVIFAACGRAWLDLHLGRFDEVVRTGEELIARLDGQQFVLHRCLHRVPWICALSELGRHTEARHATTVAAQAVEGSCLAGIQTLILWVEAIVEHKAGRRLEMRRALSKALTRTRELGHGAVLNRLRCYTELLARLSHSEDIEVATVRALSRRFGWSSQASDPQIQVRCLGRFEVWIDGEPLKFARKTMRRPLALLKLLAAHGGDEIPLERIADTLWPEAEGDRAHGALETTLTRLRRLLRYNDAILRSDGRLRLNSARVITDVANDSHPEEFLPGEDDQGWVLAERERLRKRAQG